MEVTWLVVNQFERNNFNSSVFLILDDAVANKLLEAAAVKENGVSVEADPPCFS